VPVAKRIFDILASGLGLVIISPLLLILSLLVWAFHGSPVLFRQQRPGYKGRPFVMFKFRTMTNQTFADGKPLPDSERMTKLGRFLRSSSLDELPELINVFRGEMSLVGPRPLLMKYLPLYSPEQKRRHDVLPGIAGWAQINGRNSISWEEKFKLDIWYVDNWSFWLDIRILLQTFWKSIKQEGINQPGQATMEEFTGHN
jgi:lipopolysaccharide/colanic/teichoic acid biosynthesis glycosyltransferase